MGGAVVLNGKIFSFERLNPDEMDILQTHFDFQLSHGADVIKKKTINFVKKNSSLICKNDITNVEPNPTIESYIKNLSQESFFKKFRTICLFVHEKGLNTCIRYDFSNKIFKYTGQEISTFNKLFQSIRKSKNKSFGQSTLKGISFEIIGTFLAKNYSFAKHNAILIISRDDFLPQSDEDILRFNQITNDLEYSLANLLTEVSFIERIHLLKSLIRELPVSFELITTNEQISSIQPTEKLYTKNHFGARVSNLDSQKFDHVDLFHKERIRLLGELLNTLRHEISNPLFGLKLTTELLSMEELNESQIELKDEILKSLQRCSDILEDFTDLYKSDKELKKVSIHHLVKEVLTLTKSETREILKETNFKESKDIIITTNPTWLVQILFNLIVNATHALKESEVKGAKIKIEVDSFENEFSITVTDNGPNIPTENIDTIFQPFYTTKKHGTGLGLSISRSLAKKLGGNLEYLRGKEGASFRLSLPNAKNTNY